MAVKTLQQVLGELQGTYQPQIEGIQQRQAAIPGQIQSEEQGLQAKQTQAFGDILNGARQRGLGFSGIPLGEQARYTSTEFLPALARLRQSGQERSMSLQDALNSIYERRDTQAQGLVNQSYQQDLAERQFAEQQRQFNIDQARQRAAAAAAMPSFGGGGSTASSPVSTDPIQQSAYNDVKTRYEGFVNNQLSQDDLMSDYLATASSAQYGNQKDLVKLQVYRQLLPQIFKSSYGWEKTGGVRLANNPTF